MSQLLRVCQDLSVPKEVISVSTSVSDLRSSLLESRFSGISFKVHRYIQSCGTGIVDAADFQTRRSGDVLRATFARIRDSYECRVSFLRGTNELW